MLRSAAALAGALAACGPAAPPRPNVLLISIDALRADHLSCYGDPRPTTPFLDELAGRGVRFERAFVATHGTTPSHATMLSGLYQETHRVGWTAGPGEPPPTGVPEELELLAEVLGDAGWRTIGVTDGGNAGGAFGFAQGFERFDDRGGGVAKVARRALAALDEGGDDGRPVFLFLHTYEVHSPYDPPPAFRDRFGGSASTFRATSAALLAHVHDAATLAPEDLARVRALYAAEVAATDAALRGFFAALEARGFLAGALVVVTSDHGEELGDHGGLLHRDLLYDELIRVPLIAAGPGLPRGRVETGLVSAVDLAPSIVAWAGLPARPGMEGRPVFGPGAPPGGRPVVVAQYGGRRYAVRTATAKLIETVVDPARTELYDLAADPGERRDLAASRPAEVARLSAALAAWRAERRLVPHGAGPAVELAPEEVEKLRALGYLGGR
jgi:arylsulfatase A-like enzyme